MNQLLSINIGNTNQTFAHFIGDEIEGIYNLEDITQDKFAGHTKIVSKVSQSKVELTNTINICDLFKDKMFLDMPVQYSPTLGEDRLACSYYAFKKIKGTTAIIDSGTFTTIDFVNNDGLTPSAILPGLELLKSSYQSGTNLKFTPLELSKTKHISAENTKESMDLGLSYSFFTPIVEILEKINPSNILITGGNFTYLEDNLKNNKKIHAASIQSDKNLIHHSLYFIAQKVS